MKGFRRKLVFPALYLAVGLAIFGVSYSLLGLSQSNNSIGGTTPAQPVQSDGELLMHAIVGDDDQKLAELLESGVDPNAIFEKGLPLQLAIDSVSETRYRKVKLLLDYGASPNALDSLGFTPMHTAAWYGTEPIMALLMDFGGDPNIATTATFTPYEEAVSKGNKGAVAAIQSKLPDYIPSDSRKWNALRISGVVFSEAKEAADHSSGLTDAQRKAHLKRAVDKLVDEALLPESMADETYQAMVRQLQESGLID